MNALAHRDYRDVANTQIHISLNRLEIINPGRLSAGVTEETLGSESRPRNALLFDFLYRMKAVEQAGSRIRRMRALCREHGCDEPQFRVGSTSVTVTFPRLDRKREPDGSHGLPNMGIRSVYG